MTTNGLCRFYRDLGKVQMGRSLGYCDLDGDRTTCEGNIDFCEKPGALKIYLFEQLKKEGGLKWTVRRDALFTGSQKV